MLVSTCIYNLYSPLVILSALRRFPDSNIVSNRITSPAYFFISCSHLSSCSFKKRVRRIDRFYILPVPSLWFNGCGTQLLFFKSFSFSSTVSWWGSSLMTSMQPPLSIEVVAGILSSILTWSALSVSFLSFSKVWLFSVAVSCLPSRLLLSISSPLRLSF